MFWEVLQPDALNDERYSESRDCSAASSNWGCQGKTDEEAKYIKYGRDYTFCSILDCIKDYMIQRINGMEIQHTQKMKGECKVAPKLDAINDQLVYI